MSNSGGSRSELGVADVEEEGIEKDEGKVHYIYLQIIPALGVSRMKGRSITSISRVSEVNMGVANEFQGIYCRPPLLSS